MILLLLHVAIIAMPVKAIRSMYYAVKVKLCYNNYTQLEIVTCT